MPTSNKAKVDFDILKELLDHKYEQYNKPSFIDSDPIQIPHRYRSKEDIEIAAFLTATIAWGKRNMIIANASKMLAMMGSSPYEFIQDAKNFQLERVSHFKHRTFQAIDLLALFEWLRIVYTKKEGLKNLALSAFNKEGNIKNVLSAFHQSFVVSNPPARSRKHISNVDEGSAAKRLNMFLMWLVRNDHRGVHFGIWSEIPASALCLPLDTHTGNVGRKLGLLHRNQNDWKAVLELTENLRHFDAEDPVKYDFALFSLGVFEKF